MRLPVAIVCFCAFLASVSADARAITFADSVKLDSSAYSTVTNLSDSANGTSETDNKRAVFTQSGGTVSVMLITYGFPDFSVSAGTHRVYFVVDEAIRGIATGRVVAVNGSTLTSTTATPLVNTKSADTYLGMDFTVSSDVDITSLTFLLILADATRSGRVALDAVALPEPATWLLFTLGAAGLGVWRIRRNRAGLHRRPADRGNCFT